MAPRKKKTQQKITTDDVKAATKTKNIAKRPSKKKGPVRKVATRKPRQPKKSSKIISNDNIEIVEDIIDSKSEELPDSVGNTSIENNEYSSAECETSFDSQTLENERTTCEITEQLEHLEVQEQEVMEELIEFDSVDNVVTVDYVSQEVTLEMENDNSNVSNIDLLEVSNDDFSSREKEIKNDNDQETNEIEESLSQMMNIFEISHVNDGSPKNLDELESKTNLKENLDVIEPTLSETNDLDKDKSNEIKEVEENKLSSENLLDKTENKTDNILFSNDKIKVEKTSRGKMKKQNETKSQKGQKKEITKKEKTKGTKTKTVSKSKTDEADENLIRRSSRIKSINVLKKPSVGHGLVKVKDCEVSEIKNENDKSSLQCVPSKNEPSEKPIKVKSRWRRSSELEMNVSSVEDATNTNSKENENLNVDLEKDKMKSSVKDELVESRLKQFVHLKENVYLTERFVCKEAKKMTCDCFLTEEEKQRGEMACGEDCLNRLLMIECGNLCQVEDRCANKKFQKSQFAPVEVFNTHKKGLGLRAAANIPYGEFILEYVGEVLDANEFDRRADEYSQDKNTHYYFMSLRSDAIIDATQKGNISRFINHSCEPNAETQKWTVNGELRIGFFSTRTILAGEEVTFDYRFERYGKEAQKCYCEAPSCRGWLGEEPDDDEEGEEDEEEEEEEEVEEVEENVEVKPIVDKVPEVKEEPSTAEVIPKIEKEEIPSVVQVTPKIKKIKPKRKLRKELFEDDQLDEEIDVLVTTGLKNQAHTLKLSRLMIRAKEPAQRAKLLRVLRRGELPCRRLFLDYHGLHLMHGYMIDAQHLCLMDKKYDSLRLEVLQTLAVLPISNKTMLQDSKVLPTIEKWSVPLTSSSSVESNSESNSPKVETEVSESSTPTILPETTKEYTETTFTTEDLVPEDQIRKSVGMEEVKVESSYFKNTRGSALAEEIVNIFEDDTYLSTAKPKPVLREVKPPTQNYEFEIIILATKLVEMWSKLKEVFRIPKKERIEQMKEHEREANKGYIAGLGLEQYAEKKNESRYRGMQRSRQQDKKSVKSDERNQQQSLLSRHNRRKLFALQVEQQEEDRRRKQRELWIQHEKNCMLIGTDPRFTAPFDPTRGFQCIWNPQIGQWQNYPIPPSADNSLAYGHMPNMPVSIPNTNIPPPHIQPTPSYPYGMPQMQLTAGIPTPMPPISTSRNHTHMVPSIPVGRPPLPSSLPPSLLHQITPTSGTISNNIHQTQTMTSLGPIATNIPPPSMQTQTPPPITSGIQGLHNPLVYPPQIMIGQTPSPILYQQEKKSEIISIIGDVKFLGPIPPPPKLPPRWKCAKDKYGRPYYYHIRLRKSQWEPPQITPEDSDSSSSESSSSSTDSSSEESESDEEIINDSRLLKQVKKHINKEFKEATPIKPSHPKLSSGIEVHPSPVVEQSNEMQSEVQSSPLEATEEESSIDKRLKEQFNFLEEGSPMAKRRKTSSLVQEIIISPRTEEDKLLFKEDLKRYKENKMILKKQKEIILQQRKKHMKEKKVKQQPSKAKIREMKYSNTENAKKIKETFRSAMANTVVSALNAYRKADCKEGRITNTEDFKHLARKLTHFVMLKEMKYISEIEELVCSDSVKVKAKDFIRKYMSKFGGVYTKRDDEPEHYY
ncbi:probable histone-lysine N-methyltransferase CG1716 [Harmonia axyridis]|uniref:probable histone-lysine N-methyltransferase CG1716 n=1 Tax=Harmonia axyridis TaxID=115357 RepID=UPI001E275F3F|nr:probable histone-lysine N-methyltransferase CG1716 [Harmonia axyridis]